MPTQKNIDEFLRTQRRVITRIEHHHQPPKDVNRFAEELGRQMEKHGDTHLTLLATVRRKGDRYGREILKRWLRKDKAPDRPASWILLARIEKHYGLQPNHFRQILRPLSARDKAVNSFTANQRHLVRWHLPGNFGRLSEDKQKEVIKWLQQNVLAGATDYGKYAREACKGRYALRFPTMLQNPKVRTVARYRYNMGDQDCEDHFGSESGYLTEAPPRLVAEVMDLVKFKRAPIAPSGFNRYTHWTVTTAHLRVGSYSRFFGALVANPRSMVRGRGLPVEALTMALLIFPAVWDWYLEWRFKRRGFFTAYERNELDDTMSLLRRIGGWLRQNPQLAKHLSPINGLISNQDITFVLHNWDAACDRALEYMRHRRRELNRIRRRHRDSFLPIMPVLRSASPLAEYRKIADEIVRRFPDERKFFTAKAEAVRAFLMLRLGMHAGFRGRNLRDLLLCRLGDQPKTDKFLQDKRCGELRWLAKDAAWEIYVPALAFKNWDSSFFNSNPFRLVLPDLDQLYFHLNAYVVRYRPHLLGGFPDPGTLFVRTVRGLSKSGVFNHNDFYTAWRTAVSLYGIYNPYTKRGVIEGLLPHGPHSVRDVLATHVLKQTASYELAAFAIQDTPETVEEYYSRFLPEEKSAMAAGILNRVWT